MESTYPTNDTKADLHTLRQEIDRAIGMAQMVSQMSRPSGNPNELTDFGREISLTITKLQEGKMWAGKCLERLGSELPVEFQDKGFK